MQYLERKTAIYWLDPQLILVKKKAINWDTFLLHCKFTLLLICKYFASYLEMYYTVQYLPTAFLKVLFFSVF